MVKKAIGTTTPMFNRFIARIESIPPLMSAASAIPSASSLRPTWRNHQIVTGHGIPNAPTNGMKHHSHCVAYTASTAGPSRLAQYWFPALNRRNVRASPIPNAHIAPPMAPAGSGSGICWLSYLHPANRHLDGASRRNNRRINVTRRKYNTRKSQRGQSEPMQNSVAQNLPVSCRLYHRRSFHYSILLAFPAPGTADQIMPVVGSG
jgi:hypothetical protein